jgi:hypothetical protein
MKLKFQLYKGYGIYLKENQYQASCYGNPFFYVTNLAKIKRAINKYLKDENFTEFNGIFEVK